jgi:hypothetical protein
VERKILKYVHTIAPFLKFREIMTGIGPVAVRAPRIRDRVGTGEERIAFSSAILPPYARRSKSLEVLIPIRYLKGISTGGFERNVPTRGTDAIAVIPTEANCHCFPQRGWRRILRVELAEPRFVADSPLEGDGFEPSVPPEGDSIFSRPPRNPATTNRPGSQNRILTIDKGGSTVRRVGLVPAMISTPGHRASRRRQRGALPAWSLFGL